MLTGTPLGPTGGFNWVQLVDLLVCGILAIFFLFYFNRLFGTVVSYGIRAWTWHKYRAYVDITALQISLLGGRIFFKGIRYHAHNITVFVHDGHITWRYWLRAVQEAEAFQAREARDTGSDDPSEVEEDNTTQGRPRSRPRSSSVGRAEQAQKPVPRELPCRISVRVAGVEAFVYNRSPAYDSVLEAALRRANGSNAPASSDSNEASSPTSSAGGEKKNEASAGRFDPQRSSQDERQSAPQLRSDADLPELPAWLRILPIHIECKKAAAAVGNQHTTSILTAKLERAQGTVDAGQAGALDIFKLLFNFDFEKLQVAMKPNRDYKQPQSQYAKQTLRDQHQTGDKSEPSAKANATTIWGRFLRWPRRKKGSSASLRAGSPSSTNEKPPDAPYEPLPGNAQWRGLNRYLDDTGTNDEDEWAGVEYARSSTLADCSRVSFRFYWDIPGKVPDEDNSSAQSARLNPEDINGTSPPAYGMDFGVYEGFLCYGPWADRQRINLQQVFFPASYVDAVPAEQLRPGQYRVSTIFKIFVSLEEDVVLRIPTREPSKDDRWLNQKQRNATTHPDANNGNNNDRNQTSHYDRADLKTGPAGVDARPYGWLDITVKADTTLNYTMDMFSGRDGFKNILDLDVKGTEMDSSVNHALLWRAGALKMKADLSNPVAWNTLREWPFSITCDDLELFILRDHMFLIIDLVNDWASGSSPNFYTFVPFLYKLDMTFNHFTLFLNVNDANIINDPADLDKNDFLTLEGDKLHGELGIPLEYYRAERSGVTFDVMAEMMRMRLLSPARSTLSTLLKDKQVADLPKFTLRGSYSGHSEPVIGSTDLLRMDIAGTGLNLTAYGFLVRQFINIKENYFGDYVHFKTLEEFQTAGDTFAEANENTASVAKPQSVSELDVVLCIVAEDATVRFPTSLYSAGECVKAEVPLANLDLRIVSYYLDMGLNISPISLASELSRPSSPIDAETGTQVWISHVDLDGHRAFGVGLGEPAYACTWDIDIGAIMGQCSQPFERDLALAASAFAFAFTDAENVLPLNSPNVFYDATFVRLNTDDIRLWMSLGDDAMLVQAAPISLQTNDLADDMFSQRISVLAPLLTVACVDGQDATRRHVTPASMESVETLAFLQTGVSIDVVVRKAAFEAERLKQQVHIRQHDQRTGRAPFLVRVESQLDVAIPEFNPQAMPCPPLPSPVYQGEAREPRPKHRLRERPSTSSLSASIRHGREATLGRDNSGAAETHEGSRVGDTDRHANRNPAPTIAFTSSYSAPRYPFQNFQPDESKVPGFSEEPFPDDKSGSSSSLGLFEVSPSIDESVPRTTVIIKVVPGVRAYIEPRVAHSLAAMMSRLQPRTVEQVMDAFQMQVLSKITQHQRAHQGKESILEILTDVPALQARLGSSLSDGSAIDELNLVVDSSRSNIKMHTRPSDSGESNSTLATHTVINNLELTLDECLDGMERSTAARLVLDDVLFWVGIDAVKSVHLSVRDCSLAVSGDKASYLSLLALRTVPLAQSAIQEFSGISEREHKQLLLLISGLTQHSEGQLDPPFLSRMTYILRAFPAHFRNQESWKVLARFRYIMSQLSEEELTQLARGDRQSPSDAAEAHSKLITSWAQWRNWDVPDVGQTVAFRTLLDSDDRNTAEHSDMKALNVTARVEMLRVGLGSREEVSEVVVQDTSIGLDSTPPTTPTGLMLMEENKRRYTNFQIHTTRIALSVDWSLYGIAEVIVPYVPRFEALTKAQNPSAQHRSAAQVLEDGLSRHDFHIVLSTDDGELEVRSLNLQYLSRAENLKLSLIGTTQLNELFGPCASALLNITNATTDLRAQGRSIWHTRLTSPSLYVDHRQATKSGHVNPLVTLAAAYNELRVEVQEQPLGILHVVDTVMIDEVATILKLVQSVQITRTTDGPDTTAQSDPATPSTQFNIAMLAGKLHLDVALLQTLAYRLEGTAASVRIEPNLAGGKLFDVDFDIGRQYHSFVNRQGGETFNQGILQLPPVNGQVEFDLRGTNDFFSVAMTVEQTEIEAAAIHGLMTVLERPEVQSMISAIDNGIQDVRHHVQELNLAPAPKKTKSTDPGRSIVYDVRFALLGVAVTAGTSRGADGSKARMTMGIGPMHAKASNRDTPAESNPWVPSVRAQIQDIGARLWANSNGKDKSCGRLSLDLEIRFDSQWTGESVARDLQVKSGAILADIYPESASTTVAIINHLQDKIRGLDLSKEIEYLRHLRDTRKHRVTWKRIASSDAGKDGDVAISAVDLLSTTTTTLELNNIQVVWHVADAFAPFPNAPLDDAVLSLKKVELTTKGGNEARLTILDLMLQLSQAGQLGSKRSRNSALLSEVGFSVTYWSEGKERRLAFRAAGQPLQLQLDSGFLVPLSGVQRSINYAIDGFQAGTVGWETARASNAPRASMFDTKHLASVLVEADFAGAQVHMQGSARGHPALSTASNTQQQSRHGRFGAEDGLVHTSLQTPGIALKLEYNSLNRQPTVHGELRVDASSNMLLPNVVPLMLEISNTIKHIVQSQDKPAVPKPNAADTKPAQKYFEEDSIVAANPAAIFGKTKVDLGLRICRQEFGLSCQPIARVDANAALDDFYLTVNTIDSAEEYGHFFAVSAVASKLTAQVKHAYSREPTLSYDMESVTLSLMNSKHVSGINGVSAIVKFNPIKLFVNGKQLQDLLLFREIWLPPEIRSGQTTTNEAPTGRPEDYLVQRYQMTAAAAAFPWNATVSVTKLEMDLDLGRSIGKSSFVISNLWASQQKSSNWEQNLCVGLDEMGITSTGRMSGFLQLSKLGIRMSIKWPQEDLDSPRTPLIQASIGFSRLKAKAAFDYQAFAFGDIEGFDFLMYNVRHSHPTAATVDRLVGVLDCEKAYIFCTSTSAAQAVALYQAFDRLVQERQLAYAQSLKEIEKHLKREHTKAETQVDSPASKASEVMDFSGESPFSLHTDVVVTLGAVSFGVFPSTFFDSQLLKLEASSVQARFAVGMENGKIHSGLGITIGQLQVALAGVRRMTTVPKSLDISVDEVITSAVNSKGGTILRVPKVVASMQTWQVPREDHVDYVFKSLFDGKIDVGWNLSRINFIQNMWTAHARALASRLGKALPESAVKITAAVTEAAGAQEGAQQQEKIRAEVSLPQFRYRYQALEPPIIETPQLRDMGEATPPLEWIGLNRDRLPNVTHQILIVSLLKIAKEVEDAYERVLSMRA